MLFSVIDTETNEEVDLDILAKEYWVYPFYNLECFGIKDTGELILIDSNGNCMSVPRPERFKVIFRFCL